MEPNKRLSPAVTAVILVEAMVQHKTMTIPEMVTVTGLYKSSVQKMVAAWLSVGFIEANGSERPARYEWLGNANAYRRGDFVASPEKSQYTFPKGW